MFLSSALCGQTTSVPEQKNCKRNCCITHPVKLWDIPKNQLLQLQWVQNTAARIVTQTKRSDHNHSHSLCITLAACWKAYWLPNPVSCGQLHEWHSPPVPLELIPRYLSSTVLHSLSSLHSQCWQRQRQKTLWSESIFQGCIQTVEVCPLCGEQQ